jgi:nucleoside-diphosphate-sugar epimerase
MAIRTWRSRRLFVTGGAGFLGRHIVNGHASQGWEVVAPGSRSADLRHRDAVLAMVRDWKPAAIIVLRRASIRDALLALLRHLSTQALRAHPNRDRRIGRLRLGILPVTA